MDDEWLAERFGADRHRPICTFIVVPPRHIGRISLVIPMTDLDRGM
jgi:hypothetical protein